MVGLEWSPPPPLSGLASDGELATTMGRRSQPPPPNEAVSIDQAEVHYDLGFAYIEMGLRREALPELEAALRIDPLHDSAQAAVNKIDELRRELGLPDKELPKAKA